MGHPVAKPVPLGRSAINRHIDCNNTTGFSICESKPDLDWFRQVETLFQFRVYMSSSCSWVLTSNFFIETSSKLLQSKSRWLKSALKSVRAGSTIRNWYKVKTRCFDKSTKNWYFLSSGHLCLIYYLKLFWPHAASTASDRKGAIYY